MKGTLGIIAGIATIVVIDGVVLGLANGIATVVASETIRKIRRY